LPGEKFSLPAGEKGAIAEGKMHLRRKFKNVIKKRVNQGGVGEGEKFIVSYFLVCSSRGRPGNAQKKGTHLDHRKEEKEQGEEPRKLVEIQAMD